MREQFSQFEKEKFSLAQKKAQAGDFAGAIPLYKDLVEANSQSVVLQTGLANAYQDAGNLEMAALEFRKSTQLAPEKEIISLCLFHCLWQQNRQEEAFDEAKRFLSVRDSDKYRKILSQFKDFHAKDK